VADPSPIVPSYTIFQTATFASFHPEFSTPPFVSLSLANIIFLIPAKCGCSTMRLLAARISIHSAHRTASFGVKVLAVQTSCFKAMFARAARSRSRDVVS
jgi:hypothetical protein